MKTAKASRDPQAWDPSDPELDETSNDREISREQAKRRIGCSVWQVVQFEKAGKIRTRRDDKGYRVYLRAVDVARVARTWKRKRVVKRVPVDSTLEESNVRGRVAARCYPLFDRGLSMRQVVVLTESDPTLVREVYAEWKTGFEDGERQKREKQAEEEDRRLQKEHDRRKKRMEYWENRLAVAKFEAAGKKAELARAEIASMEKKLEEAEGRVLTTERQIAEREERENHG